jgi:hypothetical protein
MTQNLSNFTPQVPERATISAMRSVCLATLRGSYLNKMKYIIFLLLLFGSAKAQQKRDNAIIVHGVTFQQAVAALVEGNYHIAKIDSVYKTVELERDGSSVMYIRGKSNGDLVIYTKFFVTMMGTEHSFYAEARDKVLWGDMMKFAGQFPNREYVKQ